MYRKRRYFRHSMNVETENEEIISLSKIKNRKEWFNLSDKDKEILEKLFP